MSTPAGWYPDPTGRHQNRWFDGNDWTDQVADGQVVGTDPVRQAAAEAATTQTPTAQTPAVEPAATQAVPPTTPQAAAPPPPGAPPGAPGPAPGTPPGYVAPTDGSGGKNKALLIVGAVVVVVALAVGLVLALGGGDDGDRERDEARTSTSDDEEEDDPDREPSASDLFDDMADNSDGGDGGVLGSDEPDLPDDPVASDGSYPPEVVSNFVDACTGSGASAALCQCTIDVLQRDVPFDRFVEIDNQLSVDPNDVPPELTAAVGECQ